MIFIDTRRVGVHTIQRVIVSAVYVRIMCGGRRRLVERDVHVIDNTTHTHTHTHEHKRMQKG